MTKPIDPRFTPSDAWLFQALTLCRRHPPTLLEWIFAADYLNHAIPTADELDGALNRLLAAGLVEQHADGLLVPDAIADAFDTFRRRRKRAIFEAAEAFLRQRTLPASVPRRVTIAPEHVRAAYEEYLSLINAPASSRRRKPR